MKEILIRGTPSPLENVSPREAWETNAYHNNSGNVAFPYGLIRNLTTEDTAVQSDWYGHKLPLPEEVNERFSMYIMPMANDFGSHFAAEMRRITKFVEQLKIPVVVVGIGGAFSSRPDFSGTRPYDGTVKKFMSAILERSATVGLRGEITAQYLDALGFRRGSHYEVIGDPTLYNLGSRLKIRPFRYSSDMRIAYNMTPKAPQRALEFLNALPKKFDRATYVPQDIGELAKIYAGMMDVTANPLRDKIGNFPNKLTDEPYRTGRIKFFLNAPMWLDFAAKVDLSIGTRIHGNIIPTHAGTPSLTLMYGSRLTELAEFHRLPRIAAEDVDPNVSLEELTSEVDFHEPEKYHGDNFSNFIEFLDRNGVPNLYKQNDAGEALPFDKLMASVDLDDAITPITSVEDRDELLKRVIDGYEISQQKVIAQKEQIDRLRAEVKRLRKAVPRDH